jgi:hypothetical protein
MDWDSEIERMRQMKEPSGAAIFWSAFLDGPMGGLFAPLRTLPGEPERIFRTYSAVFDLVNLGDQALRDALVELGDADLRRIKTAVMAAEAAHHGDDQPRRQ